MAPSTFRKAIGAVKDHTTIGLAKVAGTISPELEVLVVKATSHDEEPADEKYYREILSLTSSSRGYISACLASVSKRLSKTHDWMVALKSLMLVHRLLSDGHPSFEDEIVYAARSGMRILNMSDFRAEASSNSWDHAGFVRFYAMYLDEKVGSSAFEKKWRVTGEKNYDDEGNLDRNSGFGRRFDERDGELGFDRNWKRFDEREDESGNRRRPLNNGRGGEEDSANQPVRKLKDLGPINEMPTDGVLGKAGQLLRILDRMLACRPAGTARTNRLVLVAFQQVVKESFALYIEIGEVLTVLLDRFAEMEYAHSVKAFDVYVSAGKMIDELIGFYGWCKDVGVARSSEYPDVQRITDKLLGTLEGFLKKSPPTSKEIIAPVEEAAELDMNTIKALPPPESCTNTPPPTPEPKKQPPVVQVAAAKTVVVATEDLVNLRDDGVTAEGEGNKLALALWEEFPSNGEATELITSGWQHPAAERGRADWELALVESASSLNKQTATMAGGLDALTLNGMYDQGAVKQHVAATHAASNGSASSVVLPGGAQTKPMLALPAPDGTMQAVGGQDPFAASLGVPPPSYVQMAEMQAKQQMFVHEQQAWQQYGVHGHVALANGSGGGAGMYNAQQTTMMMPYGMPQPGGFYNYAPY